MLAASANRRAGQFLTWNEGFDSRCQRGGGGRKADQLAGTQMLPVKREPLRRRRTASGPPGGVAPTVINRAQVTRVYNQTYARPSSQ